MSTPYRIGYGMFYGGTQFYAILRETRFGFWVIYRDGFNSIEDCEKWIENFGKVREANERLAQDDNNTHAATPQKD